MKKLLAFIFLFLFMFNSNSFVFAKTVEHLYNVKNVKASDVKYIADFYTLQNNMIIADSSASHSLVYITNEPDEFYTMVFEQNGENTFFYYYSPCSNPNISNDILKRLKINRHKYSEIRTKKTTEKFNSIATAQKKSYEQKSKIAQNGAKYDFSDDAQKKYDSMKNVVVQSSSKTTPTVKKTETSQTSNVIKSNSNNTQPQAILPQTPITRPNSSAAIQSNVSIPVVLQSTINTSSLEQSDRISALLQDDLYVNNKLLAKKGSIVYGTAKEAKKAGRAYADGSLQLVFDKMLTTNGDELTFQSEPIIYQPKNTHRGAKIAGNVVGGIIMGVAAAALATAFSTDTNWATTLGVGAAAGAVGGSVMAVSATGEDVEIKEGDVLLLKTVISQ